MEVEMKFDDNRIINVIVPIIVSVAFLGCAVFLSIGKIGFKMKCTYKVNAIVSEVKQFTDEGSTTYKPVYTYTYNGYEYTAEADSYTSKKINADDTAELYIDPDEPATYYIPGVDIWLIVFFFFGAVFLLVFFDNLKKYKASKKEGYPGEKTLI